METRSTYYYLGNYHDFALIINHKEDGSSLKNYI